MAIAVYDAGPPWGDVCEGHAAGCDYKFPLPNHEPRHECVVCHAIATDKKLDCELSGNSG